MFENFGTAIVQAIGFFAIFGFFVYRLLSDKVSNNSPKAGTKTKSLKPLKAISSEKKGLFGRKKNIELDIEVNEKKNKRRWFNR